MKWQTVLSFFKGLVKSPKSSAAGVGLIATGVALIVHNPSTLLTGEPVVAILSGTGLLYSADQTTLDAQTSK